MIALLPIVFLAFRALSQRWVPVGDLATIGLQVRDVGGVHTPLIGVYSHFRWFHPGPLLFYVLAIPYRISGARTDGMLFGALAVNAVSVALIATVLARLGGAVLAALGVAAAYLVVFSFGVSSLWLPWNPTVCILPFIAVAVLAWAVACGMSRCLPALAFLGSFVVQAHIEYVPLVIVCFAVAGIGVWRLGRDGDAVVATATARSLRFSAAVVAIVWLPPVVDAVVHGGGNLLAIEHFWSASHPTLGLSSAVRILSFELSGRSPLFGAVQPVSSLSGGVDPVGTHVPIGLIALLIAALVAARRRDRIALSGCGLVLGLIVAGCVALARVVGEPYSYLLYWARDLAALTWFATAAVVVRALPRRALPWAAALGFAAAGVAVLAVMVDVPSARPQTPSATSEAVTRVLPRTLAAARAGGGEIRLAATPSFAGDTYLPTLAFQLAQRDITVHTQVRERFRLGSNYSARVAKLLPVVMLDVGEQAPPAPSRGSTVVARVEFHPALPRGVRAPVAGQSFLSFWASQSPSERAAATNYWHLLGTRSVTVLLEPPTRDF